MAKRDGFMMWDYRCHGCQQTGSCPVPAGTPLRDVFPIIQKAHGSFNPACHLENAGDEIRVFNIEYEG
jgi:hypothetical protein